MNKPGLQTTESHRVLIIFYLSPNPLPHSHQDTSASTPRGWVSWTTSLAHIKGSPGPQLPVGFADGISRHETSRQVGRFGFSFPLLCLVLLCWGYLLYSCKTVASNRWLLILLSMVTSFLPFQSLLRPSNHPGLPPLLVCRLWVHQCHCFLLRSCSQGAVHEAVHLSRLAGTLAHMMYFKLLYKAFEYIQNSRMPWKCLWLEDRNKLSLGFWKVY